MLKSYFIQNKTILALQMEFFKKIEEKVLICSGLKFVMQVVEEWWKNSKIMRSITYRIHEQAQLSCQGGGE